MGNSTKKFVPIFKGVEGDNFIGRETDLKMLDNFIDAGAFKHIALYGMPHIGKTSLLKEWRRRLIEANYKTPMGNNLLIINTSLFEGNSYVQFINGIIRLLSGEIGKARKSGILQKEDSLLDEIEDRLFRQVRKNDDDIISMMLFLEDILHNISSFGIRILLLVDEFDHAEGWDERNYLQFTELLMRRGLNLRCVVASRASISYIVNDFECKVIPFRSYRLDGFCDEDMEEYFRVIVDMGGPDILGRSAGVPGEESELSQLLFACNRTPFLLVKMALWMIKDKSLSPGELFTNKKSSFYDHFGDVAAFMLKEEKREQKSFSHIVKCYFGNSEDYEDIIKTYINLGYIELVSANSRFAYRDDRYIYVNENGEKFYYDTVCAAFISYIFLNYLNEIRDTRDVLTGLIHTLRDITRKEMQKLYPTSDQPTGAGCPEAWNWELLKRYYDTNKGKKCAAIKCVANGVSEWKCYDLSKPSVHKLGDNEIPDPNVEYDREYFWYRGAEHYVDDPDDFVKDRLDWVNNNQSEMIPCVSSSIGFVAGEIRKANNLIMPALDPINIVDNGNVILHYANIFAPYFMMLGDISDNSSYNLVPGTQKTPAKYLLSFLEDIKDYRNEISHFSRYGINKNELEDCRNICIYLLQGIFDYLEDGVPASTITFEDWKASLHN